MTTGTLENWLDFIDDNFGHLSPKSVHHVLHDILHFLRWLRAKGDLQSVASPPALALGQLPPVRIPDEETLAAYLGLIPEVKRGLFLARSYNGLRPSEARALNVQDYDFRQHELTLSHTKTGEPATVPVDWEVGAWIEKHVAPGKAILGYWPLFRNEDAESSHGRWSPASERRVHLAACKALGVYFKPIEMGRKAAATHALRRTSDIHSVQKLLRHADPRTTERYAKIGNRALVSVLRPKK